MRPSLRNGPPSTRVALTAVYWTSAEIARLENSIQHLEASNVELRVWAGIKGPEDGTATTTVDDDDDDEQLDEDSKREFAEAVRGNEETMCVVGPIVVSSLCEKIERS